jgi:hypothetical protein
MTHGNTEDDHLRGERLTEKSDTNQLIRFRCTPTGSTGGLGLNAKHAPDIGKRKCGWYILGRCDDETDPQDGKGCRGLDKHRCDTCIRPGRLRGEHVLGECSHPQETEADHRGYDDIQAHAQGDPRHSKMDRLPFQQRCVGDGALHHREDREDCIRKKKKGPRAQQ